MSHTSVEPEPALRPHASRLRRTARWVGRRVVVLASVVILIRLSGCMESLFYHPTAGPTPAPDMPGAQRVTFASRDGIRLCAWFILATRAPGASDAERPATILHVHGNAGNLNDHIWFSEFLPAAGFNLFIFDYRGYGESEGAAKRRGPLIDDTNAALDYLLTRDEVDPGRVGMYGQSLGGSIGLNVMAHRPEIRCAVIESAFSSWQDEAASVLGGGQPGFFARSLAWALIGDSHRADDAITHISGTGRPILLLHGDADSTVPVEHSRRLKAAGGEHVRLIEYSGGDHNSLRETHPEMQTEVVRFFRDSLRQ